MGRCARHRSVGKGRPARRCPPLSPDPCLRKGQGQGLPRLGAWATMRPRATFTTRFCPLGRKTQSRRLDPPAVLALCARLQLTSLRSQPTATSAVHRGHSVAGSQLLANCCAVCANRRTTKTERKGMAQTQVPAHVITRETAEDRQPHHDAFPKDVGLDSGIPASLRPSPSAQSGRGVSGQCTPVFASAHIACQHLTLIGVDVEGEVILSAPLEIPDLQVEGNGNHVHPRPGHVSMGALPVCICTH